MKKLAKALVVTAVFCSLFFVGAAPAASARPVSILQFDTMVGIPSTLTGTQGAAALRGINGGGKPWTLSEAKGNLGADGSLKVEVQGLVLAATGSNPISSFAAIVSCVTSTGAFDNILTAAFPATIGPASLGGGDADIETTVALPQPCIAPIVFVTNSSGAWFAATGN